MKTFVSKDRTGVHNRGSSYIEIDKHKSVPGFISIMIGVAVFVLLMVLFLLSYLEHGKAGIWLGLIGIMLVFLAITGIIFAISGLSDSESKKGRPIAGAVLNAVMLSVLLVLYIVGV